MHKERRLSFSVLALMRCVCVCSMGYVCGLDVGLGGVVDEVMYCVVGLVGGVVASMRIC